MGLDVVDDEDVEAEEEDLEVKRVFDAAKEKHRKIMTGMYVIVENSMSERSKIHYTNIHVSRYTRM